MLGYTIQPEIREIIEQRNFIALREVLAVWSPPDIAELLNEVPTEDRAILFRILPRELSADVFEYLDLDDQEALLKGLAQEEVAGVLNEMAADDRTSMLEELPGPVTQQLISLLTPDERKIAISLLGYPKYSIGRLMTPDYIAVRESWTVQEVLDFVREHGRDSESLLVLYVVDERGRLIDDIRIRKFLLAPTSLPVSELMDRKYTALSATDEQETAITIFRKNDREALPVVDRDGFLLGIITIDDVLDVEEEEATEDIQKIGGMEALEEPYMLISFGRMIKKRAGWLVVLFIGEMLTATAMGYFEDEIRRAVVLSLFVPLIISSGGNSGSQASTLVIRAMALGEVRLKDWFAILRRELLAGLMLGLILGVIGFLRISIWSAFTPIYGPHWILVAWTVSLALVGIVLWGTISGSMLPLLLKKLGFDPASSSAPFVATIVDVTGLVIYFSIALLILSGKLL